DTNILQMSQDIVSFLSNRSLGLGTSSSGIRVHQPSSSPYTRLPPFLSFQLDHLNNGIYYQKDVIGHYGCVNAIDFSPNEELVASGGDDRRMSIWSTDELLFHNEPKMRGKMKRKHYSNIFCLAFDPSGSVLYSAGNDNFFVSSDIATGQQTYGMQGSESVHDISVNMRSNEVIVTRCRGRDAVYFYDPRTNTPNATISFPRTQLYSAQFNLDPSSTIIGVCGEGLGVRFIDRRNLAKALFARDSTLKNAMYGTWNKNGTKFAYLRAGGAPVVYDFREGSIYKLNTGAYKNAHTIKSIEWIDDDWFLTGSDDYNIYGWNTKDLPDKADQGLIPPVQSEERFNLILKEDAPIQPQVVMTGHRSIVNHVRFSHKYQFVISSGVEKILKVWNTRWFPYSRDRPKLRKRGAAEDTGDEDCYPTSSPTRGNGERRRRRRTDESPRMLRYFDSIVGYNDADSMDGNDSDDSVTLSDSSSEGGNNSPSRVRMVEDTDELAGRVREPELRIIINYAGKSALLEENDSGDDMEYRQFVVTSESESDDEEIVDVDLTSDEEDDDEDLLHWDSPIQVDSPQSSESSNE
ncbi:hypothetical protein PFISCL1PPCAC_2010, partial [Pristionchus fissidentatus]